MGYGVMHHVNIGRKKGILYKSKCESNMKRMAEEKQKK